MTDLRMEAPTFHPALRLAAKIISYIFHPLFLPVYVGWFFIYDIRLFSDQDPWHKTLLLIQFFINYTLLPLVTVLIAKGLGFVQSVYLKTQKDRIIPYVASGVFYFWVWYVFKNQHYPDEVVMFGLAVFLASSIGLLMNSYFKISMHGLSIGVILTLMMIMALTTNSNFGSYLAIAFLIGGVVCTARLINADHNPFEVYAGLFFGIVAQLIAWAFV